MNLHSPDGEIMTFGHKDGADARRETVLLAGKGHSSSSVEEEAKVARGTLKFERHGYLDGLVNV